MSFDLGAPATVYLRFYPEEDPTNDNLIAEVSNVFTTAGSKTMSWDGMGTGNVYLPDEAYRFVLAVENGTVFDRQNLLSSAGTCTSVNFTNVNAGQNKYANFTCSISQHSRLRMGRGDGYAKIFNRPVDIGDHNFSWGVRDSDGKIIDINVGISAPAFIQLREDAVIIKNNNPVITGVGTAPNIEVIATPHTVLHSFEQVSQIVYQLDQDADVSIKLLKPCFSSDTTCNIDHDDPSAITVFDGSLQAKNSSNEHINHSFEWRGYDFNSSFIDANNILVSDEGYYTFSIKATSAVSGLSATYLGTIYLGH